MNNQKERGFTIVELLLALSLLSFILVFAIIVLSQLVATYNKSLTLTQINQAIRQLDNDVAKGFRFVSPGAFNQYSITDGAKKGGVFCAKGVTYLWNIGIDGPFKYQNGDPLRLVRIEGEDYCNNSSPATTVNIDPSKVTTLLGRQSMVLDAKITPYGDVKVSEETDYAQTQGTTETSIGRLIEIKFVLSTAGNFSATRVDTGTDNEHLTCQDNVSQNFCSFGEFNSIIYMRGK